MKPLASGYKNKIPLTVGSGPGDGIGVGIGVGW